MSSQQGARRAITLVASREITTRVRARSFVVTNAILLIVIVGGLIVTSLFVGRSDDSAVKIGVVGADTSLAEALTEAGTSAGDAVRVVPMATIEQARQQVKSGDVKVALAPSASGEPTAYTAVTKDGLSGSTATLVRTALAQRGLRSAVLKSGANPDAVASQARAAASVAVTETSPKKPDEGQRLVVAYVGVFLLVAIIMQGGGMVAVGVAEEKTSRVVEILLATIRPLHLLWGKIIGIGTILISQLAVLSAAGLITGTATGLLTLPGAAISMFIAVIVWFLLGFLFFATLFAAAGSMVARQEEIQSATLPLTFLALAVLYAAFFGAAALTSTPMTILSWIPPFSASLMPMRIATGNADTAQVIGTILVMVATCLFTAWTAAKIYQRSILRTGSRVTWLEVVRRAR